MRFWPLAPKVTQGYKVTFPSGGGGIKNHHHRGVQIGRTETCPETPEQRLEVLATKRREKEDRIEQEETEKTERRGGGRQPG